MLQVGTMMGVKKTGNVLHNSQTAAGSEKGLHVNDKQIDNSFRGFSWGLSESCNLADTIEMEDLNPAVITEVRGGGFVLLT